MIKFKLNNYLEVIHFQVEGHFKLKFLAIKNFNPHPLNVNPWLEHVDQSPHSVKKQFSEGTYFVVVCIGLKFRLKK